jgi:hypothetical protein
MAAFGKFVPAPVFHVHLDVPASQRWEPVMAAYGHLLPALVARVEREFVAPILASLPWKLGFLLYVSTCSVSVCRGVRVRRGVGGLERRGWLLGAKGVLAHFEVVASAPSVPAPPLSPPLLAVAVGLVGLLCRLDVFCAIIPYADELRGLHRRSGVSLGKIVVLQLCGGFFRGHSLNCHAAPALSPPTPPPPTALSQSDLCFKAVVWQGCGGCGAECFPPLPACRIPHAACTRRRQLARPSL